MSIECGECERDLRGGHDMSCSRYNLTKGVALAMHKALGQNVHDEEFEIPQSSLRAAEAAIAHVREYDKAQAEG